MSTQRNEKSVRVGIIGLGLWGQNLVEAFADLREAEVVAVCSHDAARNAAIAAQFSIASHTTNYEDWWSRDDIEAVVVATADDAHLHPVLGALSAGKHVFLEKPVALSSAEARQMQQAASTQEKLLMPAHILRFEARYAAAKDDISSGALGELMSFSSRRVRGIWHREVYGKRVHPAYALMAHDLDLAIWYAASRVKKVRAWQRQIDDDGFPDLVWASLEFESGLLAMLHASWLVPDNVGIERPDRTEIIGTRGTLHIESDFGGYELWSESGLRSRDITLHGRRANRIVGALHEEVSYFCECVRRDSTSPHIPISDAVHGIEVIEAVLRSATEEREIAIAQL